MEKIVGVLVLIIVLIVAGYFFFGEESNVQSETSRATQISSER